MLYITCVIISYDFTCTRVYYTKKKMFVLQASSHLYIYNIHLTTT